jgi:hypothetical protein
VSKKSNVPEVLGPAAPNIRAQLDAYIEQKITAMIGADETGIFEPWFQRQSIATEIKKLQTVPQQRKWYNYFNEWGCLICQSKDGRYAAEGMCNACYQRIKQRLQTILRFTERERPDYPSFTPDRLTDLASDAVQRQLEAPEETRDYITKAERSARRHEIWRQARALHVEQKLTWRTITQRLDPEGFAQDPEAAMARMKMGALKVSMVRDLQDVARAALRPAQKALPATGGRHRRKQVKG